MVAYAILTRTYVMSSLLCKNYRYIGTSYAITVNRLKCQIRIIILNPYYKELVKLTTVTIIMLLYAFSILSITK